MCMRQVWEGRVARSGVRRPLYRHRPTARKPLERRVIVDRQTSWKLLPRDSRRMPLGGLIFAIRSASHGSARFAAADCSVRSSSCERRVLYCPGRRRHWTRCRKTLPTCPRLAPCESRDIVAGQVSACVAGEAGTMLLPGVCTVPSGRFWRLPREEIYTAPDLHVGLVPAV